MLGSVEEAINLPGKDQATSRQAVGEIQIGALVPEGYEDSGGLISALARVAR